MPWAAPRLCSTPGCPNKVQISERRCPDCNTRHHRTVAKQRGTRQQRGYGVVHEKWRTVILARDPLCRLCKLEGSTVADHIVPLKVHAPEERPFRRENGQGCCARCHNAKRATEARLYPLFDRWLAGRDRSALRWQDFLREESKRE